MSTGLILACCISAFSEGLLFQAVVEVFRGHAVTYQRKLVVSLIWWGAVFVLLLFGNYWSSGTLPGGGYASVAAQDVDSLESGVECPDANKIRDKILQKRKAFRVPKSSGFNYVDPDKPADVLEPFCDEIFSRGQGIMDKYGFQYDSCRNQCEHLLMMLTNEVRSSEVTDGKRIEKVASVARLHAKLFFNYRQWCQRMKVSALIAANELSPETGTVRTRFLSTTGYLRYMNEMLLWLFIWGEAGNLKHMPECLCYLFHKTLGGGKSFPDSYSGFYLDAVVSPIYRTIAKELVSRNEESVNKKTYDDFNEFFWSPKCLMFSILGEYDLFQSRKHVAEGLAACRKTYVEKRSWLHPLLSVRRVFEWHLVTFTLLAMLAFANTLVWDWGYTAKIMSVVFLEISLVNVFWTCLEVWVLTPFAEIGIPSICGYILRLLWGYLVLVYQILFYQWSFQSGKSAVGMEARHNQNYWWWQYMWLSLITSAFYIIQCFLCYVPQLMSWVMQIENEYLQAVLNILYPTSQLYVGKKVHVGQIDVLYYILFWWTLIAWKLTFGYYAIIQPLTVPSLELYDDFMNFEHKYSFIKTLLLLFVWWFPHFLVYNIDFTIWYSTWSSVVGGYVAISDRLGAVSTMRTLRDKFYESSVACVKHVMPSNTDAHGTASKLMSSKEDLAELILVPRQKNQLKNNKKDQHAGASSLRSKSMNNLLTSAASEQLAAQSNLKPLPVNGRLEVTPAASRLEDKPSPTAGGISQQGGTEKRALDDVRQHIDNVDAKLKKKHAYDEGWTIYARIWNEIILQLRLRDYLDNKQQEVFQFTEFKWLQSPIYLPLFYTAGTVDTAIFECENFVQSTKGLNQRARSDQYEEFSAKAFDFPTREACRQSVELTHWVLSTLIGPSVALVLTSLVDELSTLASSSVGDLFNCFNIDKLKIIKGIVSSIAKTLLTEAKGSRKSKPVVTAAKKEEYKAHGVELALRTQDINTTKPTLKGFKKSQSTGNLQGLIVSLDANQVARQLSAEDQPKVFTKDYLLADPARDKVRDDIKKLFKEVLGAYHAADDNIKLHLRPNSEFFTDDFVASELIDKFCALKEALPVVQMLEGILLLPQTSVSCRV
jgi:hypothetical protein